MTRILFIDDAREPTPALRKHAEIEEDARIVWVKTSREAIELLRQDQNFNEIWFDHDLGMFHDQEDTTIPVAQYLSELAFEGNLGDLQDVICIIHTSNPVGRDNLAAILNRWDFTVYHVSL